MAFVASGKWSVRKPPATRAACNQMREAVCLLLVSGSWLTVRLHAALARALQSQADARVYAVFGSSCHTDREDNTTCR